MPVCTFCKIHFEIPRGMTIVQKDGSLKYFCSGKCRKNSDMGRDNKKLKWVRKNKEQEEIAAKKK